MRYEIVLSPQAIADLRRLPARTRTEVREKIEIHLRYEPSRTSRSRIKRLRGLSRPQFRLRVGEIRIFFDVAGDQVQILTIVTKEQALRWLQNAGESQ